jgi:acid phosphatase (class A)
MFVSAACVLAAPACAAVPAQQAATPAAAASYLDRAAIQALADAVPPAPAAGSAIALADIAASDRLRALENTDRWILATRHAEVRPALALAHFDCALGFRVTAEDAPRLVSILERVLHDANEAAELAKARAFRPRPVGADPERAACQVVSAAGRASPSYPSGSATVGAAYGEVIAALVPDHAAEARRIGHEMAVSRMVCGMHYPSDVAQGEALGKAAFRQIAATPGFQTDAVVAGREIARARAVGATSPACAAERAALATPIP